MHFISVYTDHSDRGRANSNMNFITTLSSVNFVILVFVSETTAGLPFPKEFQQCRRGDPKLDMCARDAIQKAVFHLTKGIPKYGIAPIDPMLTTVISMAQDFGPIPVDVSFRNVSATGFSTAIIRNARVDEKNYKISASVYLPRVTLSGTYELKARLFVFPLEGKGPFVLGLEDIVVDLAVTGKGELRSGSEYLNITRAPFDMDAKKITFYFGNIFNSDGALGDNINRFLNRFSNTIYKELKPLADRTQGEIARQLAQPFFDRVPFPSLLL